MDAQYLVGQVESRPGFAGTSTSWTMPNDHGACTGPLGGLNRPSARVVSCTQLGVRISTLRRDRFPPLLSLRVN